MSFLSKVEESASKQKYLHCPICKKSFTNDNKRRASKHLSYCRKKHLSSPVPRRKACDECVRAKVRCNFDSGGCSRCLSRGKTCTYPGRYSGISDFCSPSVTDSTALADFPSRDNGVLDADDPILSPDKLGADLAAPIDTISGDSQPPPFAPTWDNGLEETGFPNVLDLMPSLSGDYQIGEEVGPTTSCGETQAMSDIIASGLSEEPQTSIPALLTHNDPSSILERRKFSRPEFELTVDLALHTLRSFLYVMAERDSIPPFIHPKYGDLMKPGTSRPSPLYAAIKLAKMLFLDRGMNKTLVWSLIRMEQERLLNDHPKFDKWEALEALQSLLLYVLMRVTEGRHDYTNFDTQLLGSVYAVCRYIGINFDVDVGSDELEGETILWKDWVFSESRRRCAIIFLILDGILQARISDPSPAMPEFSFFPAPSPGTLWSAENELDWTVNYAGYLNANATHGMLRNGDLVALKNSVGHQHDRWYRYADSFGLLVTLVADIIF